MTGERVARARWHVPQVADLRGSLCPYGEKGPCETCMVAFAADSASRPHTGARRRLTSKRPAARLRSRASLEHARSLPISPKSRFFGAPSPACHGYAIADKDVLSTLCPSPESVIGGDATKQTITRRVRSEMIECGPRPTSAGALPVPRAQGSAQCAFAYAGPTLLSIQVRARSPGTIASRQSRPNRWEHGVSRHIRELRPQRRSPHTGRAHDWFGPAPHAVLRRLNTSEFAGTAPLDCDETAKCKTFSIANTVPGVSHAVALAHHPSQYLDSQSIGPRVGYRSIAWQPSGISHAGLPESSHTVAISQGGRALGTRRKRERSVRMTGFNSPVIFSHEFCTHIESSSRVMNRAQAAAALSAYVKSHGFQDPDDGRFFRVQGTLRRLFPTAPARVAFRSITGLLAPHVLNMRDAPPELQEIAKALKRDYQKNMQQRPPQPRQRRPRMQHKSLDPKVKQRLRKSRSGVFRPARLSPALSAICGDQTELPRPDVTRLVWKYIKDQNLQDSEDPVFVLPDEKLKEVCGTGDRIHSLELSKYVSQNLTRIATTPP